MQRENFGSAARESRVQLAPPSRETVVPSPLAPPFENRSCWNTPIRLLVVSGFTSTHGSTSELAYSVPFWGAPWHAGANGLRPEAWTGGPTAAPAETGTARAATAPPVAKMRPRMVLLLRSAWRTLSIDNARASRRFGIQSRSSRVADAFHVAIAVAPGTMPSSWIDASLSSATSGCGAARPARTRVPTAVTETTLTGR